jgi:hypothetical protein
LFSLGFESLVQNKNLICTVLCEKVGKEMWPSLADEGFGNWSLRV